MLGFDGLMYVFYVIIIHYIADFLMQDERWAQKKSHDFNQLLNHTFVYSGVWAFLGFGYIALTEITNDGITQATFNWHCTLVVLFTLITFVVHTATDYFTSPYVKGFFVKKQYGSKIPNWGAFSLIGLDQVLHYIQLFVTLEFLLSIA